MNEYDFNIWIESIITRLNSCNESQSFIEYCVSWFRDMRSGSQYNILRSYDFSLAGKQNEYIHKYLMSKVDGLTGLECFEAMYELFLPLLKLKYNNEQMTVGYKLSDYPVAKVISTLSGYDLLERFDTDDKLSIITSNLDLLWLEIDHYDYHGYVVCDENNVIILTLTYDN